LSRTKLSEEEPKQRKKFGRRRGEGVPELAGIEWIRQRRLQMFDEKFVGLTKSFARERGKERGEGVPSLL
jgi:hypothetical protein